MTIRGAMLFLAAGGMAVVGCGSDAGAGATDGGDGGDAGGDGPPRACGNVQPCGGDVVGDWMFVEECESLASIAASKANYSMMAVDSWCPGQTLAGVEPAASGSLVLAADGSYMLALVFGGYIDIDFPASCIDGATCDDATAGFQAQIDAGSYPNPNVTSISCAGSSNCLCHAAVNVSRSESGTYSTSNNVLTFAASSGAVTNKSYCVVGNALHIVDTAIGPTGQTVVDSDLVAMKH